MHAVEVGAVHGGAPHAEVQVVGGEQKVEEALGVGELWAGWGWVGVGGGGWGAA